MMNSNPPIKIAIQEDMLPGPTLADRFHQAADLGLEGIEFWSQTLPDQVDEIVSLNGTGGVFAASINNGQRSRFLDPDPGERKNAMSEIKEALTLAGRIDASGVVFVPHFYGPLLPDLTPWKDAISLERNLLSSLLEDLAEYAQKAGVELWVEPVNRYETHLLNRLDEAASIVVPLANPKLGIVADLFHMALEEPDIPHAIKENRAFIAHVHLADSNRRLPGKGTTDFARIIHTLADINYSGWMALECDEPGNNLVHAGMYGKDLQDSIALIKSSF